MDIHTTSIIGSRERNEDKLLTITNLDKKDTSKSPINFFAIFDGHGGNYVSKLLSDLFPKFFMNTEFIHPYKTRFINEMYNSIQELLKTKHTKYATESGSTSLVCTMYEHNKNKYIQKFGKEVKLFGIKN